MCRTIESCYVKRILIAIFAKLGVAQDSCSILPKDPLTHEVGSSFNSVPNDKILDATKLKAFADGKINVAQMMISVSVRARKHCGKRRKCWLPAFSPFPTMFSKGFSS